jgi:hypothetical protein
MANKKKFGGILVMMLVFGFALIGCKTDDGGDGNGGGALNFSGTWSKGSGSEEKTLIINLTTGGEWSSVISDRNIGGTFILTSETVGTLKRYSNTGNAVLSSGKLYVTGFSSSSLSQVNGIYTKKSDDDDVGDYDAYC